MSFPKNPYHTLIPSHLKRKRYNRGADGIEESLIHFIFVYIEKTCRNDHPIKYYPSSQKERNDVNEAEKSYIKHIQSDEISYRLVREYRGLKNGNYHYIGKDFARLVDLYFWFKFEEKKWFDDVKKDFDMENEVPEGEQIIDFEPLDPIEGIGGYCKIIPNENRKYPNYKRKYEYKGIPKDYRREVRQEKFKELIDLYPSMW